MVQRCHSRVPVYTKDRSDVVALLLTKTLIKLNPDDAIPISRLVGDERFSRAALFVNSDMPLFDLLNLFQTGRSKFIFIFTFLSLFKYYKYYYNFVIFTKHSVLRLLKYYYNFFIFIKHTVVN